MRLSEVAYAKINLALHVRERRADGYHELESLFAFVDDGDRLTAHSGLADEVRVFGEFAGQLTDPFVNIVASALSQLPRPDGWIVTLEKNLPVAAGLGGGSADAGALFRMMDEAYHLPGDWQQRATRLGADVPACVKSVACIGKGTGTELTPVDWDLAGKPVLLVNPRVPLPTGPVFKAWDGQDRGPLPEGRASDIAREGRNDLQDAAIALCPVIGDVLAELASTEATLVRMSGSGATCFALFDTEMARQAAAAMIASRRPGWWQMQGRLR